MTRRAFPALRVILLQGQFGFKGNSWKIWFEVRFWQVFGRFREIHVFVWDGASKINYFDVKDIRFLLGWWKAIGLRLSILMICNCIFGRIFENSFAGAIFSFLGGPAGSSALEKTSPPQAGEKTEKKFLCNLKKRPAAAKNDLRRLGMQACSRISFSIAIGSNEFKSQEIETNMKNRMCLYGYFTNAPPKLRWCLAGVAKPAWRLRETGCSKDFAKRTDMRIWWRMTTLIFHWVVKGWGA